MTRKERIYEFLRKMKHQYNYEAVYTAEEIANATGAARANVSSDLNRLFEEGRVEKLQGRPVRYRACATILTPMPERREQSRELDVRDMDEVFHSFIGYDGSMRMEVEKAKAAVLYPPNGLPMLIQGQTGVGKTMFAKLMYEFAKKAGRIGENSQFVAFNCADYATNPQLIISQLFGHARGAFTGATEEKAGLVEQADKGVLFLDEVHRLPDTAQEMLFFLIDFGQYRRLGEAEITRSSRPIIILATTEERDSVLLSTFRRRIPITVVFPTLAKRSAFERLKLIEVLFEEESQKLGLPIKVDSLAVKALLAYDCPGNVGQLQSDIRVSCAKAYVGYLMAKHDRLMVTILELPPYVKEGILNIRTTYADVNLVSTSLSIEPGKRAGHVKDRIDIYELLEQRHEEYSDNVDAAYIENAMMLDVEGYFFDLLNANDAESRRDNGQLLQFVSKETLTVLERAEGIVRKSLDIALDANQRVALAVHLNAAISRIRSGKEIVCPVLERVKAQQRAMFDAALEILAEMKKICGIDVPDDEAGFIANLLRQIDMTGNGGKVKSQVVVLCHGEGSAGAMARVANGILGREFVEGLFVRNDIPMEDLATDVASLSANRQGEGIVLLVDSEPLLALEDMVGSRTGLATHAVSSVSTAMVIEAALLAAEHNATSEQIYNRLQNLESSFSVLYERQAKKNFATGTKKAIVTACISGCGAANRLKMLIEERFAIHSEVEIITVDIASIEGLKNRIDEIAAVYDVICVVGVDVGLDISVPFISADEFILGPGMAQLAELLNRCSVSPRNVAEKAYDDSNFENVVLEGGELSRYLFYLDGRKLAPVVIEAIGRIESRVGALKRGKRIMLFIHLCCMVERLIFDKTEPEDEPGVGGPLREELNALAQTYRIRIPPEEYDMIQRILELVSDK